MKTVFTAGSLYTPLEEIERRGAAVAHGLDRGHVDGVVELAVAPRVEPVPHVWPARGLDGRGRVVAGVVPALGNRPTSPL